MQSKVKEILCEVKEDEGLFEQISSSTNIIDEVGLDSLQMINFILKVEDEFDVEIDFDDFEYSFLSSLEVFCEFISNCRKSAS